MLPFFVLPLAYALIMSVALLIVIILIDANGNRILFRMSIRNVIRRPGTTALVIGGLMIGTAIISASFVVGDTMDNMITDQVTKGMGQVDFELQSVNVGIGGLLQQQRDRPAGPEHQHDRACAGRWTRWSQLRSRFIDTRTMLSSPSVFLLGLDSKVVSDLGGLVDQNGDQIKHRAVVRYRHSQ